MGLVGHYAVQQDGPKFQKHVACFHGFYHLVQTGIRRCRMAAIFAHRKRSRRSCLQVALGYRTELKFEVPGLRRWSARSRQASTLQCPLGGGLLTAFTLGVLLLVGLRDSALLCLGAAAKTFAARSGTPQARNSMGHLA